jgi:hypothetical protein
MGRVLFLPGHSLSVSLLVLVVKQNPSLERRTYGTAGTQRREGEFSPEEPTLTSKKCRLQFTFIFIPMFQASSRQVLAQLPIIMRTRK